MTSVPLYFAIIDDCFKWASQDPLISAALAAGGIAAAEVQAKRPLYTAALELFNTSPAADSSQAQSSQTLQTNLAAVKTDLVDLRRVLNNNVPSGDPLHTRLALGDPQPARQDLLLAYAVRAFTNGAALSAAEGAVLANRAWTKERFTAALTRAQAVAADNDQQEGAKAASVAHTDQLYNAIDALDMWFRPFAKDARALLAKLPGALEKMQLATGVPDKPRRPAAKAARKPKPPVQG